MKKTIEAIKFIAIFGIITMIMTLIYYETAQTYTNAETRVNIETEETETIPFELEFVEHATEYGYIDTTTEEFRNNYIDLRTITNYTEGNKGLQLNTKDGNSYALDTGKVQNGTTEVYNIISRKDYNKFYKKLLHRNGKIIIEIITGTVDDAEGNGTDAAGYYIGYNMTRFKKGNKVQSVFVYNPDSNYTDDIIFRVDTLIK